MFCSKKIVPLFFFFCSVQSLFAQSCDNVGFENGTTSGWICRSGRFGVLDSPACDIPLPILLTDGACMNQGGMNGDLYPAFATENRHTLMSDKTGTDPNSLNTVRYVAPDSLFPSGVNSYSFRIGNALGTDGKRLALAESIKFPFTVTAQNAGLTYLYAAFLREALPAAHALNQAPHFEVKIMEKKNGGDSLIDCGYYQVVAGAANNFFKGVASFAGVWKYTNWTKVSLDLRKYIGKQLTIEFTTVDCFPGRGVGTCIFSPGPHSAYAYIDLYCAPVSIDTTVCEKSPPFHLNAMPGSTGNYTFAWTPATHLSCVDCQNPVFTPGTTTTYTVTLSDKNNLICPSKKIITVKVNEKPQAAFTANPSSVSVYDPTIQFIDQSSTDVISWKWDLGDNKTVLTGVANPLHQYPVGTSGIYNVKLIVKNHLGCVDSVQHPVEVRPEFVFYIPNAFTPISDDGKNDTFFGKGIGITKYHIWIFDRWGNMVFQTEDLHTGWDGRVHNGSDMAQQDVYVWKVHLIDITGKEHQYIGTVTLLK